jgi:hypothetical protein
MYTNLGYISIIVFCTELVSIPYLQIQVNRISLTKHVRLYFYIDVFWQLPILHLIINKFVLTK